MKDERRMILQMIEDGKITAEEGVALLEALEKSQLKEEDFTQSESHKQGNHQQHQSSHQHQFNQKHSKQEEQMGSNDLSFDKLKKDIEELKKELNKTSFEDISHTAKKIGEEVFEQSKTVGNKLGDLVERFITKVKDLDFDFSFGNMSKVEKVLVGMPPMSGVIDLTTINGKVEITGWDQPEYRIEVTGAIRSDNQLEANAILNEILHVEETDSALTLSVEQRKGTKISLEVYLPKQLLNDLKVRTSNGAIEMENINLEGGKLETNNGAILIESVQSTGLYCETSNGRITIEDSIIEELFAKTSNGSVRLDGTISKVKCYTSNGGIRYTLNEARAGGLDFDTTNGPIEVRVPHEGLIIDGDLTTSHGSLDCTLPKIEISSVAKEVSHRHLRFKSIEDVGAPFAIVCKTTNGGIRVHPFDE